MCSDKCKICFGETNKHQFINLLIVRSKGADSNGFIQDNVKDDIF
jgi:hypothetical protein